MSELIRAAELANRIGVSKKTISKWTAEGKITPAKVGERGRSVEFLWPDVKYVIDKFRVSVNSPSPVMLSNTSAVPQGNPASLSLTSDASLMDLKREKLQEEILEKQQKRKEKRGELVDKELMIRFLNQHLESCASSINNMPERVLNRVLNVVERLVQDSNVYSDLLAELNKALSAEQNYLMGSFGQVQYDES